METKLPETKEFGWNPWFLSRAFLVIAIATLVILIIMGLVVVGHNIVDYQNQQELQVCRELREIDPNALCQIVV